MLQANQLTPDVITEMIVVQNWTEELKSFASTLIPAIRYHFWSLLSH
jgi:hypothetical protein